MATVIGIQPQQKIHKALTHQRLVIFKESKKGQRFITSKLLELDLKCWFKLITH